LPPLDCGALKLLHFLTGCFFDRQISSRFSSILPLDCGALKLRHFLTGCFFYRQSSTFSGLFFFKFGDLGYLKTGHEPERQSFQHSGETLTSDIVATRFTVHFDQISEAVLVPLSHVQNYTPERG
jgi:hypothetical protein